MSKKNIKNQIQSYLIIGLALVVVGGIAIAGFPDTPDTPDPTPTQNINVEGDYNYYYGNNPSETLGEMEVVGAGGPSLRVPWDFKEGIEVDGEFIVDGDKIGYYNIRVEGNFDNVGTTTGNTVDQFSTTTFAYWKNPNQDKDLIIENLYLDNTEAFSATAYGFKCGTTTSKGDMSIYPYHQWTASSTDKSGGLTLIASSSFATTFNAVTDGFVGVGNYPGTAFETYDRADTKATSTDFILGGGEIIVCTWNLNATATSTRSTNPDNGFTGAVKMKAKAYMR